MNKEDLEIIEQTRLRFDKISESARERIYQIVLKHFQKHPASPWSGKPLVELERSIKAFYAEMGWKYTEVFRETLPKTMQKYYDTAVQEMKKAGLQRAIVGNPDPQRVKYFMDSTFEQVAMKTTSMSFQHIKQLRSIAADVTRQMSLTGATRKEISKAMLNKAMEIPGFQFIDNAGKKWQAKSYFDMLARTELMTAARASYDDKCAKEGFDVVELTYSGHSCDSCDRWEGRLFSLTGATKGLPTKDDLIADGVFHPNCTHSYTLVPQSVFEEDFNPDGTPKRKSEQKADSSKNIEIHQESYRRNSKTSFPMVVEEDFHATVTNAIDKVHSMGNMPVVPIMLEPANPDPNIFGTTIISKLGKILQVKIFENSPAKAITELHEIGHCLDTHFNIVGTSVSDNLFDAIDATRRYGILQKECIDNPAMMRHIEYLLSPKEMFSRAYSQYITLRSGDKKLLSQLNLYKKHGIFDSMWDNDDFESVANEFDKLLKSMGLRK